LVKEVVERRKEGKTLVEESPVKSSGSNGIVEKGVQELEGQIRALFVGLGDRLGRKLDSRERIVAFMPEFAAYGLNRLKVGLDGKVPYQRARGKRPTVLGLEFGEKVLFKLKLGAKMEKINPRWDFGIFVGIRRRSNEILVSRPEGIFAVRTVRRIPVERRWSEDCVNWVKWVPWRRHQNLIAPPTNSQKNPEVPSRIDLLHLRAELQLEQHLLAELKSQNGRSLPPRPLVRHLPIKSHLQPIKSICCKFWHKSDNSFP
jgi:hypothetical protein